MIDPRVERLAELVVNYSLEVGEGQVVRIDGFDVAAPLALAIYREALRAGAHPYTNLTLDGLHELLVKHGSDDQLEHVSPTQWREIEALEPMRYTLIGERRRHPPRGRDGGEGAWLLSLELLQWHSDRATFDDGEHCELSRVVRS